MPTYDYVCNACDYEFEHFQTMSSAKLQVCPECEGELKRLIGAGAGILFKGSGFYQTDYRNSKYHSDAKADKKISASESSISKKESTSSNKEKKNSSANIAKPA